MVRGIANSKIRFGDLILLLRYFFKLKVSTHPSFVLALFTPKQYLWKSQIVIFALLAFSLPLYNLFYLLNHDLIANLESYWLFLRVDLFFVACACFAAFIYKNIQPIQIKSTQKIKSKLIKNGVDV
jgi:hypothetical protein